MAKTQVKILEKDCEKSRGDDKTLPYTAFMVTYRQTDGILKYDIVTSPKQVDIFDYYWDEYGKGFVSMNQTEGRANPKLWTPPK